MWSALLLLPLLVTYCSGEYSNNDCLVGDLRVVDCRFGTFAIDTDEPAEISEVVSFDMHFAYNWTDVADATIVAEQQISATVHNGTMRYFYTKLTDQPMSKLIGELSVYIKLGNANKYKLKACAVAKDLSDADSLKWEDCHMMLTSQHYTSIKVYVPTLEVGSRLDCDSCTTSEVSMWIQYSLSEGICSTETRRVSYNNETIHVEGRSYFMYMRYWEVYPDSFAFNFRWPPGSLQTNCQLNGEEEHPIVDAPKDGTSRTRVVLHTSEEIKNLKFLSWQPTEYFATCLYGSPQEQKVASVFLSLFIVSIVICCVMVVLLGWSKYASWQWYGGDFEWEHAGDDDVEGDEEDAAVSALSALNKATSSLLGRTWAEHRRASLSALSLKNFMYSKSGDDPLSSSAAGNMEIGVSITGRRRKSSIDSSTYSVPSMVPPVDTAVINPLFAIQAQQNQTRADAFKPTVRPKRAPEPGFDWDQFGAATQINSEGVEMTSDNNSKIHASSQPARPIAEFTPTQA